MMRAGTCKSDPRGPGSGRVTRVWHPSGAALTRCVHSPEPVAEGAGRVAVAAGAEGDSLAASLAELSPASPELIEKRELLRRSDTKFLVPARLLGPLVGALAQDFRVLRGEGGDLSAYHTLYYDTPGLRCYHDHRRGRRLRQKVRVREYVDRSMSFVEVKCRRSEVLTVKQRFRRDPGAGALTSDERVFVATHCRFSTESIGPVARVAYRRAILLGAASNERVTIDVDLAVGAGAELEALKGVAIVEVKQPSFSASTRAMRALRDLEMRWLSLSKYCTSMVLARGGLPCHRFLPALRAIERMRS